MTSISPVIQMVGIVPPSMTHSLPVLRGFVDHFPEREEEFLSLKSRLISELDSPDSFRVLLVECSI